MPLLTQADLDELRNDYVNYLDVLGTIRHVEQVSDGAGGTTEQETETPDVPMMVISTGNQSELIVAERLQVANPYTIYMVYGTVVSTDDVIIALGHEHEVVSLIDDTSYQVNVTAICRRTT